VTRFPHPYRTRPSGFRKIVISIGGYPRWRVICFAPSDAEQRQPLPREAELDGARSAEFTQTQTPESATSRHTTEVR
jgi:hypothetical protein